MIPTEQIPLKEKNESNIDYYRRIGKLPENEYHHEPKGVCATLISFDVDKEDKVRRMTITGGCDGNVRGIAKLLEGMVVTEAINRLRGVKCADKSTSCVDQIARALAKHTKSNKRISEGDQSTQDINAKKPSTDDKIDSMLKDISHLADVVLALEGSMNKLTDALTIWRKN